MLRRLQITIIISLRSEIVMGLDTVMPYYSPMRRDTICSPMMVCSRGDYHTTLICIVKNALARRLHATRSVVARSSSICIGGIVLARCILAPRILTARS